MEIVGLFCQFLATGETWSYNREREEGKRFYFMTTMIIFDVVITLFGGYLVYSAQKMKQTGEISSMMVAKEQLGKCRDREAFIGRVYKKEAIFGVVTMLVGLLNLLDEVFFSVPYLNIGTMLVFLVAFLWFNREFRDALSEYFL